MHRAQMQLHDLPGAPLVSSHRTAAKHYITPPQTGENRTLDFWLIAKPPGNFCTSNPHLRSSPLICLHGCVCLLTPVFLALWEVKILNSVCIDNIHRDQEVRTRRKHHRVVTTMHCVVQPLQPAGLPSPLQLRSMLTARAHSQAARRQHRNNCNEGS